MVSSGTGGSIPSENETGVPGSLGGMKLKRLKVENGPINMLRGPACRPRRAIIWRCLVGVEFQCAHAALFSAGYP